MSLPEDFTFSQPSHRGRKRPVTNTDRRRQGGNASDERQKIPAVPQKSGSAHDGGQQFERKMVAVIGLRGLAKDNKDDDFQLSLYKDGFGKFNKLVYTTRTRRYFLQLKHTDNPDTTKLVHSNLVPLLHKCFESYLNIIQDPTFKEPESSEFIIYTNMKLGRQILKHSRKKREIDEIFKTCNRGEIFNFTQNDVYSGVQKKVKESKDFGKLSQEQQELKLKRISEFMERVIMATGQKGQKEIDNVIIEKIRQLDAVEVDSETYETELLHFKTSLEAWWTNKKEEMTPKTLRKWLQEAKTKACVPFVKSSFESCKQKISRADIKFSERKISLFQDELFNKRHVHWRSDEFTSGTILLMNCVSESNGIFANFEFLKNTYNKNMLLHAWLGGDWEWLIVLCDSTVEQSDISETFLPISEIINRAPSNKRAIILTACKVEQISNFVPIDYEYKIEQLSNSLQEMVLERKMPLN